MHMISAKPTIARSDMIRCTLCANALQHCL